MTGREFSMVLISVFLLALVSILHFYEFRYLITVIGTGDMAVSRALDLVISGKDYSYREKK